MHFRIRGRIPIVLASSLVIATFTLLGQTPRTAATVAEPCSDSVQLGLAGIMSDLNMSCAEVVERMKQQEVLSDLDLRSLDPGFGQVATRYARDLHIDYYTASDKVPAAVQQALEAAGFWAQVSVVNIPYSVDRLQHAADALNRQLDSLSLPKGSYTDINVPAGRLVVGVGGTEEVKTFPEVDGIAVDWQYGAGMLPAAGQHPGGRAWYSGGALGCTAGFVVQSVSTGKRGISTAGHCDFVNSTYDNSGPLSLYGGPVVAGNTDLVWKSNVNQNDTWNNNISCCGASFAVVDRKPYSGMNINDFVCKMGSRTSITCGNITSLTQAPGFIQNATNTYPLVSSSNTIAGLHDSGGPVYKTPTGATAQAWGWLVGINYYPGSEFGAAFVFMPQNFSQGSVGAVVSVN